MPVFTSSIEVTADYPTIKPSLNLNFARARALDPRITFTRASVGTYVGRDGQIKTAGRDEARFDHDPVTLESLGLLIEESRTNSITYSQPTSDVSFGSSATKTFNAATAPNGKTEAFRITHNGSSGNSNWRATRTVTFSANSMVLSVWAKGGGGNNYFTWSFQNLGGAVVRAGFKLEGDGETSIITSGNGGHTLQIEKYPDGWYRCIIIGNTQSSGTTTQFLYTVSSYNESSSVSGGSVLLWGFQLETGSFPTSYIPTSAATVTRQIDNAYILNDNVPIRTGVSEYSFYLRGRLITTASIFGISRGLVGMGDSVSNRIRIAHDSQGAVEIYSGNSLQASFATGSFGTDERKVALAVKKDDFALSLDGGTVLTDTSGNIPADITTIGLGQSSYDAPPVSYPSTCYIKEFRIYPKRLTNAQLQLLTS